MNELQAVAAFAAIGQEHRLRVVRALVTAGPEGLAAGVLAGEVGMCLLYSEPGAGSDLAAIRTRAEEHKYTPTIGRSHGIHAEPVTFGLKLAQAYAEFDRCRARLVAARVEGEAVAAVLTAAAAG